MPIPVDVFPLAAGLSLWPERRYTGRSASGGSRRHRGGCTEVKPRPVRGCGEWARNLHQVEHMRGRFYSPAWHCFLNSDQGADPNSLNQYAYAGGNPMMNVDPSGMSWLSDLVHHPLKGLLDPLHLAHSARVNWDDGRQDIEIGAAVVVCAVVDYCTFGTGATLTPEIMGEMVATDAGIGAVAGGAIKGTWRGACEGACYGALFAVGYAAVADTGFMSAVKPMLLPHLTWTSVGTGMGVGGVVNTASHGGNPLTNFVDGAFEGGLMSVIAGGVVASNLFGTWAPLPIFAMGSVGERFYGANRNGLLGSLGLPMATDTTTPFGEETGPLKSAGGLLLYNNWPF